MVKKSLSNVKKILLLIELIFWEHYHVQTDPNADVLDLSELLDYSGTVSLSIDQGQTELVASEADIASYVKVDVSGNDTVISVDRDGTGNHFDFTTVVTLKDVHTDLHTLLLNNQLVV